MVVRTSLTSLVIFAAAIASAVAQDQMPWVEEFPQACQQASAEGKLVLLHFYSDDCPPCVKVEKNVFSRQDVAATVGKNYVPMKIHARKNPELATKYNVRQWPTDVFVTPSGQEVFRTVSPQTPLEYTNLMNSVAAQTGVGLGRNGNNLPPHQQIAANQAAPNQPGAIPGAPAPNGPWVMPAPRDAIAQVSAQANSQAQWVTNGASSAAQQYAQQTQQNVQQAQQNLQQSGQQSWQFAQAQAGAAVNQTTQALDQTYQATQQAAQQAAQATHDSTQAAANNAKEVLNRYTTPMTAPPAAVAGNPAGFAPWQPAAAPPQQPAVQPVSAQAYQPVSPTQTLAPNAVGTASPYESNPALAPPPAAALASGTYPIVMEGFCPVTLLSKKEWKKGQPEFGAVHRRRTFLFASAEAQQTFLADPDRYSPVMVGYDPVKFMQTGELIDGRATFGLTYRKQIYLFSDDASLKTFWQNPRQFTDGLRQAMTQNERGTTIR
ncbi:thiol:disulfide interchange protein precursor [Anatilimnocola aggregata]|uniref:Thiol:disulfide interchange protein n=1 Tax=Anatilimnocola aggregata TaxID=2528021 RepID=A0A517Y7Y5_9BACT|nr:thioredoxin family protein [Anatilimnocola aggregata]QDU26325.1 thiol:disulfide interchange protein precursor [Anatilimnocola aggregata]